MSIASTSSIWFTPPESHKPMSWASVNALSRLKDAYIDPKKVLAAIQNRFKRQVRSERRNAMLVLLQVIIYYADHETFKVGRFLGGAFKSYSLHQLSKYAGLSEIRTKRAFNDLVKKGYLISENRWERKEGKIINLPSIKRIAVKLFKELDLYESLDKLRHYKMDKRLKKEKKCDLKTSKMNAAILKDVLPSFAPYKPLKLAKIPTTTLSLTPQENQRVVQEAQSLYQQNPSHPLLYYAQLLKDKLLQSKTR